MEKNMTELELVKKLITIPSFVDELNNEAQLCEYVYAYVRNLNIKDLKVSKQIVEGARFNIIASKGVNPTVLVAGHLDTVQPRASWNSNPFEPVVKGDRLYGLGAADMKGSLAAFLTNCNG